MLATTANRTMGSKNAAMLLSVFTVAGIILLVLLRVDLKINNPIGRIDEKLMINAFPGQQHSVIELEYLNTLTNTGYTLYKHWYAIILYT